MLGVLGLVVAVVLVVYFLISSKPELNQKTVKKIIPANNIVLASRFAPYKEEVVNVNPKVPTYSVDKKLDNVTNANDFNFSDTEEKLLVKNAFVVKRSFYNEFFQIYERNRYKYIPNFITTDSILHNYHLLFDFLLRKLEEQKLAVELKQLSLSMLSDSLNQYNELRGTKWENASKRNVEFFAVGNKLLNPSANIPSIVANEVNRELNLIKAHQDIEMSPIMNVKEDYTQYIPRGHYDKTEQLKAYFKSMMWYGRFTFRMKNDDEIKSALLITLALNKENNRKIWDKIYEPLNFFVGKSDDITYYQFENLAEKIYGPTPTVRLVVSDKDKFASFVRRAKDLTPPKINSMPIFQQSIEPNREKEIKGFRFMGQKFTIDAAIFQQLIYHNVGDKTESCKTFNPKKTEFLPGARYLPKGLDIPATFGSSEAKNILNEMGETKYACYLENMSKMNKYITGLNKEIWTQNLYWGWFYQLLPLLDKKSSGYPTFMRNDAWLRKDLNTFLGSWSELKHDTVLYAKQVYAELGGGPPKEKDDRGYVEPNPYVYARLASLLKMTKEGLETRGLLTTRMKGDLNKLEQLAMFLETISEKELNNEKLTNEEYELIRSYGGQLEHFWLDVNKDEPAFQQSSDQENYLDENPAAIIADVATDPISHQSLEEGIGKIFEIYVVVPIDGKLRIAKGGVYSYYEFTRPISNRLSDKKWRELLNSNQAPNLPFWTNVFMAK